MNDIKGILRKAKKRKRNRFSKGVEDAKEQGNGSNYSDDDDFSNNDDSDDEMVSKQRKRNHVGKTDSGKTRRNNKGVRVKWSMQERNILKAEFKRCKTCPVEGLVREVMAKHPILMKRTVPQVKSRARHMIKTGR